MTGRNLMMRKIPGHIADRLLAAAQPIALNGLNDTKFEDIVVATGIPKATLYYYFDGKEGILAYLLEDALREVAEEVAAAVHADGTGADRLGGVIEAQLRVMVRRPDVCRALIGELSRAARMPVIAEMIAQAYLHPVETVLVAGAADGSIAAQDDPGAAAVALFGAITASALTYLIAEESLDVTVVATTVRAVIIDGLRPR